MSTVVLIACSATKLSKPAPAYQFYSSDLFQKNWEYAKKQTDEKVNAVNEFTFSDLAKFFSDRYEGREISGSGYDSTSKSSNR